jgi:hypothetical protein
MFKPDEMRVSFSILSIAYIIGIFLFADSSVVSDLSAFNPYSLLHIPLYGILTFLLVLSFMPLRFNLINLINPKNPTNSSTPSNSINPSNWRTYFLLSGGIALIVAITDEFHQAYVPGRDASVIDVLLDFVGIILVLFFTIIFMRKKILKTRLTQ